MAGLPWRKSSFSNGASACIEVQFVDDEVGGIDVLIRESDDPDTVIATSPTKWQAFVEGVRAGEFALPAGPQVGEMG